MSEKTTLTPATLGADPEFTILDSSGRVVSASGLLPGGTYGEVGCDGAGTPGELRPTPGDPEHLYKEIKRLLETVRFHLPVDYTIRAGAAVEGFALGGHIHAGDTNLSTTQVSRIVRAVWNLITVPLNQVSNSQERSRVGYGNSSDCRSQNHGYEFRSPPSWISHPTVTKGVTKIFGDILETVRNHQEMDPKTLRASKEARNFFRFMKNLAKMNRRVEDIDVFHAWKIRNPHRSTDMATWPMDNYQAGLEWVNPATSNLSTNVRIDPHLRTGFSANILWARRDRGAAIFLTPPLYDVYSRSPLSNPTLPIERDDFSGVGGRGGYGILIPRGVDSDTDSLSRAMLQLIRRLAVIRRRFF